MVPGAFEMDFILEVYTEDASVIMSASCVVPVFAAGEVTYWYASVVAQAFDEFLQMFLVKGTPRWKIFVTVRKSNEAIIFMELSFMYHADCPLSAAF